VRALVALSRILFEDRPHSCCSHSCDGSSSRPSLTRPSTS
jgi:hypothetical protein